ncbi:MAG: AAC(3) family N-acetyltransferase [Phycisphaerae bacterium]
MDTFRTLGLDTGDSLIVHSAFRALGEVDGGPSTVIQALLNVIGPSGNLMLPTFNYAVPLPEPYFDPAETPGATGIITEIGRKWPGAMRSAHPTHSVAVIGPGAESLTRDHLNHRALGIGSPIDLLAQNKGKVLLIGVGHNTNSTIHVGEEYAKVPKAPWAFGLPSIKVRLPNGMILDHQVDTSTSCSTAFGSVEYFLRKDNLTRDFRLGACKFQLMHGRDVIRCVCEMIRKNPDILLCTHPGCLPCTGARKNLRDSG